MEDRIFGILRHSWKKPVPCCVPLQNMDGCRYCPYQNAFYSSGFRPKRSVLNCKYHKTFKSLDQYYNLVTKEKSEKQQSNQYPIQYKQCNMSQQQPKTKPTKIQKLNVTGADVTRAVSPNDWHWQQMQSNVVDQNRSVPNNFCRGTFGQDAAAPCELPMAVLDANRSYAEQRNSAPCQAQRNRVNDEYNPRSF